MSEASGLYEQYLLFPKCVHLTPAGAKLFCFALPTYKFSTDLSSC